VISISKGISLGFLLLGFFLIIQIVLPVMNFKLWEIARNIENSSVLINPRSGKQSNVMGVSIQNTDNFSAFYSNIKRKIPYPQFSITIPKLKIENVTVYVQENDLYKGLVQLPGTALPGERGNVFISGHSSASKLIPYKNVYFSNLQKMEKGDEVIVEAEGTRFKYSVVALKVVDPKDTSVIEPPDDGSRYISLMTCVPPGLNFKRLVVLGKMI
jgi:LPXTG-site transpeptidase (sortase) family protein